MRYGQFCRQLQWVASRRESVEAAELRAKIEVPHLRAKIEAPTAALPDQSAPAILAEHNLELEAEFDAEIAEIDAELERLNATDESGELQRETAVFANRLADAIADRLESRSYA
jgi:hypothetical protein